MQTYNNIEIIVVDDGSTDNTYEVISTIQTLNIPNQKSIEIKYFFKKNEGAVIARNYGFLKSSGEYIVFHDSDDLMDCWRIEYQIKDISTTENVDGSVCSIIDINNNKLLFKPESRYNSPMLDFLKGDLPGSTQAWMFSRRSIEKIGGYDEHLKCRQDLDLSFRFLASNFTFVTSPNAITYFYNHEGERVSQKAQTIEGMASTLIYYRKRVNYIISTKIQSYLSVEIKNLFHFRVACLRLNARSQARSAWNLSREMQVKYRSFYDLIYSSYSASYAYYLLSKAYYLIRHKTI
jgi:glycosyltransferase involved in cell wall biosynthesis